MNFIFTCQCEKIAYEELTKKDSSFEFIKWIDSCIGFAKTKFDSPKFCQYIKRKPIVFVRHIFKVDKIISLKQDFESEILTLSKNLDKSKTFSIQLRFNKNNHIINVNELSQKIVNLGYNLDVKNCQQVISIYIDNENLYVGIDNIENNLSKFKGGIPHYKETDDFVSRAEFKLLEALDVFNINTTSLKTAADFGSAPGGWTKVLANNNIYVTSIDPAKIKPSVQKMQNVDYKKMTIQEYFFKHNKSSFDIIVNDMKMDVFKSINLTLDFYDKLNDNGIVIITFKLPKSYTLKMVDHYINCLLKKFNLIGARQLFYNRNEITVAVKK